MRQKKLHLKELCVKLAQETKYSIAREYGITVADIDAKILFLKQKL
jgi:hypothetical protein